MWLNLYLHKLVSPELHNLSFPSPNFAECAKKESMACRTYGEAASALTIDKGRGQLFKLFYRGFDVEILDWLPYRTNPDLTLPEKFNFEDCFADPIAENIFNAIIRPCILPADFRHGRTPKHTYEFYYPN